MILFEILGLGNVGSYTASLACAANGNPVTVTNGSITMPNAPVTCTFTNNNLVAPAPIPTLGEYMLLAMMLMLAVSGYNASRFVLSLPQVSAVLRAGLRTVAAVAIPTSVWIGINMALLAETTGIFGETAAGVTLGALREAVRRGQVGESDRVVLLVTGDGLKTPDPIAERLRPVEIDADADALLDSLGVA